MMSDTCTTYPGDPWHADETEDSVRLFRGNLQIAKMPKRDTPYAEYWPEPHELTWMLQALNAHELKQPMYQLNPFKE
jgi:hypothetical protein